MNFKKIISIATAAVIAAGICTGVPAGTGGSPLLAITAEAAKYPGFKLTEHNNGYVSGTMPDGTKFKGKVISYEAGRYYSTGTYRDGSIDIRQDDGSTVLITSNEKGSLTYTLTTAGGFQVTISPYDDIVIEGDYKIGIDKIDKDGYIKSNGAYESKTILEYHGDGGDIVIPDGIKFISIDAFKNNDKITSVIFPESCVSSGSFENCKNLKKVEYKGNGSFYIKAFKDCTNLKSVIVKGKLYTDIGTSAFENCTSLETFKIYKMAYAKEGHSWYIAEKAFKNCKSLKTINIPDNCTGIYKEAFKNCISLETVKISGKGDVNDRDFTILESAFENCYSLKSINILKRCYEIKEKAFLNCYNLAELKIPEKTWLRDYSVGYIYNDKKYTVADGKKTVTYTNAEGEKVKVTPKQITLTLPYLSNAEVYYVNKNNIKYKYTDGTSPSSISAPKASLRTDIDYNYNMKKYLTIDTSDGAAFYRLYKKDENYGNSNVNYGKYVFYKDVTSANNLFVDWGTYVVVAYYKDKNGGYITSRPTDML